MPLINCEINLMLNWSEKCVIAFNTAANEQTKFAITNTELYVPFVTYSTQYNAQYCSFLLQQWKSRFNHTINWNKYQSKITAQATNPYLDYLFEPSFWGVNRLFVLLFEHFNDRIVHTKYFHSIEKKKDYNIMIDEKKILIYQ